MISLYILVPISLVLLAVAIAGFLWAVERRQFEDLDSPAWRVLLDDDARPPPRAAAPPHDAPDQRPDEDARDEAQLASRHTRAGETKPHNQAAEQHTDHTSNQVGHRMWLS